MEDSVRMREDRDKCRKYVQWFQVLVNKGRVLTAQITLTVESQLQCKLEKMPEHPTGSIQHCGMAQSP